MLRTTDEKSIFNTINFFSTATLALPHGTLEMYQAIAVRMQS